MGGYFSQQLEVESGASVVDRDLSLFVGPILTRVREMSASFQARDPSDPDYYRQNQLDLRELEEIEAYLKSKNVW